MDEANRQAESERKEAGERGPFARLLLTLTIAACLLAAVTGIYGAYNFPDAPFKQTGAGYAGKTGKPHTREEFEAFILWQRAMFIVFPAAFVLGFACATTKWLKGRER
jgi:hypothetical protein